MLEPIPYPLYFLVIPIGLRLTCYYFHGWFEEKIFRPFAKLSLGWTSLVPNSINLITRGFSIDMVHRYFLILSIPLIAAHISISLYHTLIASSLWVALDSFKSLLQIAYSLMSPATWSLHIGGFNIAEWTDSVFLTLYVASCHVVRYFCGSGGKCLSCKRQGLLSKQTFLNRFHGDFFWISIATLLVHSAVVELINLGMLAV